MATLRAPCDGCGAPTATPEPPARTRTPMADVLDLAERFWNGAVTGRDLLRPTGHAEEIAPDVFFLHAFANVTALRTEAGLVLVDTGNYAARAKTFESVRGWSAEPVAAAVYTHGHVDHACGLP